MNKVEKILKWIREVDVKSLPYDVVSVGWGPKEKNGKETDEYCVIFTVKTKKPIEELNPKEIIPKDLEIIMNDEGSDIEELVSFKTDIKEPNLCEKLVSYCNQASNTVDPVKQHRIRRRKLTGGIEAMTIWGAYVGTLGIFVKDKTDGQIVALSNNHVFANSQVTSQLLTLNEQNMSTTLEISAYQPSGYWATSPENDYIGKCKRAVMIGNINPNIVGTINSSPIIGETSCDAAIVQLSSYNLIDSLDSPNVLNFTGKAPFQFATDSEIDSLAPGASNQGAPIFRSGRTLGSIGSPGNTYSCNLSVYQLNTAFVGTYSGFLSYFSNSFYVRGNVAAGAGGDSGSAMFALYNQGNPSLSAWKLIGLLFAGPSDSSYTIGCRITNIAKALDIVPWDTTIPSFSSNKTVTTLGNVYSQTLELSGRKFYQVGFLN
jgi:hypothetical protein